MDINRAGGVVSEATVLVEVILDGRASTEEPLQELTGLAESAGARVVGRLMQRRAAPDVATYLGKGKVDELRDLCQQTKADVVIFDNDLSPAQTRNLEQATKCKVLDRTELILDIFASRTNVQSPARRRVGAVAIFAAAVEADVDALVAYQGRHRHAWPW